MSINYQGPGVQNKNNFIESVQIDANDLFQDLIQPMRKCFFLFNLKCMVKIINYKTPIMCID